MELQRILDRNLQLKRHYDNVEKKEFQELFATYLSANPQLEFICNEGNFGVYDSLFKTFDYCKSEADKFYPQQNLLFFGIHFFGHNLTNINFEEYTDSDYLPILRTNCDNLTKIKLKFCTCLQGDFKNVFEFMPRLSEVKIQWQCKQLFLPPLLIQSLEHIKQSLRKLYLSSVEGLKKPVMLSETFTNVFELFKLTHLKILYFKINSDLVNLIGNMELKKINLIVLSEVNLNRINTSNHIENLSLNCNVDDEFVKKLVVNSKNLEKLTIGGANMTDKAIEAIQNLHKMKHLDLWGEYGYENNFIQAKSIKGLQLLKQLRFLRINNYKQVTNEIAYQFICQLEKLRALHIMNTSINRRLINDLLKVEFKKREESLTIFITFEVEKKDVRKLSEDKNIKVIIDLEIL